MDNSRRVDPNYLTSGITEVSIPMLPGYRIPKQRQNFYGKKQLLTGHGDGAMDRQRPSSARIGMRSEGVLGRQRPQSAAICRPQSAASTGTQPGWLTEDRQVLRFYGYFNEDAFQSSYESRRVRKIILYYYVADCSLHIAEPKIQNSGMPSGVFVKRARISKPDGELLQPVDFSVGGAITIRARRFHLVDADRTTREYYKENLGELSAPMTYPEDAHTKLQKEMKNMRGDPEQADVPHNRKPDTRRQFMEFDQKVLRFSCFWDDTKKLYGEKRKFIVNYFLANNTIEVREVMQPNSGRDAFPMLLRRQALPSKGRAGEIVKPLDLVCGEYLHIYGRDMLLVDCDEFTTQFYRDFFGIDQRPLPGFDLKAATGVSGRPGSGSAIGAANASRRLPSSSSVPPSTGFGSEEDSLQSHYSLNPKAPKQDTQKARRMDRKVLRFRAQLVNPPVQDAPRRFVIACYLVDDTISIFEPPQRNSGIVGGKFLERGKFRNMEPAEGGPPRFFLPRDFYVGAKIPIEFCPHQQLQIMEADAFTLKYCEGACKGAFAMSDIDAVLGNLCAALEDVNGQGNGNGQDLRRFFVRQDENGKGYVQGRDVGPALRDLGVFGRLHAQERITLARRYDDVGDGRFAYHEMCDDLSRAHHAHEQEQDDNGNSNRYPLAAALAKMRANPTSLRKVFRRVVGESSSSKGNNNNNSSSSNALRLEQFLDLLDFYQVQVTEEEARELFAEFDVDGSGVIADYNELCDAVYPCVFGGEGNNGDGLGDEPAWNPNRDRGHSDEYCDDDEDDLALSAGSRGRRGGGPPSVSAIIHKYFDGKKYELHKQFRKRDRHHSGTVDEDAFIEALAACNPKVGDDEKFELALHYFPNGGDQLEYQRWIGKAVR